MIDILMATYNGAGYLEEQLKSIENQTWKKWRLTVHDDASSDGTWAILEDFQQKWGKEKVVLKRNDPATGSAKSNFISLIQACEGNYMMCCDQDDIWHPDKVERTFKRMRQMERKYGKDIPLLVHTDLRVVNEALSELHPKFHVYMNLRKDNHLAHEMVQNQVTGCTVMFNRALKTYVDKITDTDTVVMHDHWLALIAAVFGKISYVDTATIDYRQHQDNSVGAQDAKSFAYMKQRFLRGRKKFRQDMQDSCNQVKYFVRLYAPCINDAGMLKLLEIYAFLYDQNKFCRIFCFLRYGFLKKGTVRKVMQLIWG